MTERDDTTNGEAERDLAAAEIAIGLRRARPEELDAPDVQSWIARMMPLAADIPSIAPSPHVWRQIASRIGPAPSARTSRDGSIWRSLPFWRWLAFGGIGLTAASLLVLFGAADLLLRAREPQQLVAIMGPSDVSALFTAVYDPKKGRLSVAPVSGGVSGSRVPELWYVPAGGKPQSLGVFDPTQKVDMSIPASIVAKFSAQDALAISLEPAGGSPTGSPTGPVIAQGRIRPL